MSIEKNVAILLSSLDREFFLFLVNIDIKVGVVAIKYSTKKYKFNSKNITSTKNAMIITSKVRMSTMAGRPTM